jgi:S-disulfanyl-L-cysteine oxidoreductase SoxD
MSTFSRTMFAICALLTALAALSDTPNLGQPATPELVQAWDISIAPDGEGLPPGRGSAAEGAIIYERECALCHGKAGVGGPSDALTGGIGSLASEHRRKLLAVRNNAFRLHPTCNACAGTTIAERR